MASSERPIRVAIVGGGCAGVTTAFELSRPEHNGIYEVTVYQQGFRLGGKGASGRGPGNRIYEHGLHIWMGFYENAFRLLRECYDELGRDPSNRFAKWDDVFFPDPLTGVKDDHADGTASHWLTHFPRSGDTPGDPTRPPQRGASVSEYMVRATQLVEALLISARRDEVLNEQQVQGFANDPNMTIEQISRWLRFGQLATVTMAVEAMHFARFAAQLPGPFGQTVFVQITDRVSSFVAEQLDALIYHDTELRRVFEIVDLTLTSIRGVIRDGLVTHPDGFNAISHLDWREWLTRHGASKHAVESSFLDSLYNIAFAYENGDPSRPNAAAGEALRCAVRAFLDYRGSFFWKMRTGMGDAVFAPYYEVLRRRGVKFEFFHRLSNIELSPVEEGDPYVTGLVFDVQARPRGHAYNPLIDVRGLPCWPAQPLWNQLEGGEHLATSGIDFESYWDTSCVEERRLQVTKDFDAVVLAVGLGAIPNVASEIVERITPWSTMLKKVKTTATKALQLWLRADIRDLGWDDASVNLTGVPGPFETWADMSQLIPDEDPSEAGVRSIAYFCSALQTPPELPNRQDTEYVEHYRSSVRDDSLRCVDECIGHIWPNAVDENGFRYNLLLPAAEDGEGSIDSQYFSANVNPSDRYVLFVKGSCEFRISPLQTHIDNLTIAGDWTDCGLNVGCVEAAVMSGRLAAHAISLKPELSEIVGYDHP
jgi:uncharacterized protein with NAD-binding domain and iron-sulfur cluster